MMQYFIWLIFILSVALAAGGVVLATRLRKRFNHEVFSVLMYYLVFIYTFGFYGIWGQVVIKVFLSAYISEDLLTKFTDIAMLLGLPFLVFGWLMIIQFATGITGRKNNKWFVFWFLLINFSIIVLVGYFVSKNSGFKPITLMKNYFISVNLIYTIVASIIIFFGKRGISLIHDHDRKTVSLALFLVMILQTVPLLFYSGEISLAVIFILTFFAGNTFLPVYLNYGTMLSLSDENKDEDLTLEQFCRKFEVSPRETDIIREICNGLSNKEISEKLFISLQTVKDHTHRIYIKTNVKSRGQLMTLVREVIKG